MIIVLIRMKVLPEKLLELKQTLPALMERTRRMKGCMDQNVFHDIEDEKGVCLIGLWESRKHLEDHLQSAEYKVLTGTRSLLVRTPEIMINEVSHSTGWENLSPLEKAQQET